MSDQLFITKFFPSQFFSETNKYRINRTDNNSFQPVITQTFSSNFKNISYGVLIYVDM